MSHPNFVLDTQMSQPIYRCCEDGCWFDTFDQDRAIYHAKFEHPERNLPDSESDTASWVAGEREKGALVGVRIGIGLLTWNTREASVKSAEALVREADFLRDMGAETLIYWYDNGSTDGTKGALVGPLWGEANRFLSINNDGQSVARNWMLDRAIADQCDYFMMVDGDVEIVPFSAYAFALWLKSTPDKFGCIGMYTYNCTDKENDPLVAKECRKIEPWMVKSIPEIAWTQYGMFRMGPFVDGVRFDEHESFKGVGWGFEDDDLYLQLLTRGYQSFNCQYFRYMHRTRNSSLRIMSKEEMDSSYAKRKAWMLEKWKGDPNAAWHLRQLANQTPPAL